MDPVYKCPACNLILNRPVQLKCGHRQCHFCRRSAETEAIICSTCHEETSVEDIIIDELLIQEINELPIICPLCTWSGSYRNYKEHIETTHPCECKKCSATFTTVEKLIQHQQLECPATFVKCPLYSYGCEQLFPLNETRAHTISDVHIDALRYAWNCCMCTIETAREDMKNNYHNNEASISSTNNEKFEKLYSNIQILTELLCDLNSSKSTSHSSHDTDPYASINNGKDLSQVGITQEQCQIMKQEIDWLKTNYYLLQTQLMEQPAATDGLLIWSIPDARKKIDDTLCLKELVLDSRMIVTAMNGHRVQAYLYLNDHIIRTCPVDTNELNEMIGFDDFMPKNRLYQDPSRYIRDDKILIIVKVNQTNAERFAIYPPCLQNALEIIGLNDKP
ncbi:unnamed protein product [Rotaria sordida]|uniref:Uncharacterized protein n=1 Tax=Rotaria sordida TaxID=392033 RepID=A0A814S866_9BILA|nr:unnamed protein product [Rotaria sordida]